MPELWWCSACGAWRAVHRLGHSIGCVCDDCGSGRVRPPGPGEAPAAALPPVSAQQLREELES